MITDWHCERCGKSGSVTHDDHADARSVLYQLEESHRAATKQRPVRRCAFDIYKVRASIRGASPEHTEADS